ncbi:MAG: HDOD domain-containing protein [Candidatus Latescibacteria bacterium]|nr:HDOD domain-containing protein [Candidatus Latescibacterota bacterium]
MKTAKHTLLLVDDEPHVLASLRRSLRKEGWQLLLAGSGQEGLALLAANRVDLVVSDMRMPQMDGAAFLRQVRCQYPQVTRLVLTGYAEREAVKRAFEEAGIHEMIAKPWDDEELRTILRSLLQQQERQESEVRGLHRLIGHLGPLPVLPQVYFEVRNLIVSEEGASVEAIARVILREPAMAAKLMQVANTSFFGQRRQVESVERAITVLGLALVHGLVLAHSVFQVLEVRQVEGFSHEALWRHSLACGLLARQIAQRLSWSTQEQEAATLAGLLHDLGKLVLANAVPLRYARVILRVRQGKRSLAAAERELLGVTHATMGGHLAEWWNLPLPLVEAIRWHCRPSAIRHPGPLACLIHLADVLVHRLGIPDLPCARPAAPSAGLLAALGMETAELDTLTAELKLRGISTEFSAC